MRPIQEKVKDIVEVRTFQSLRDYSADPAQTLASYHFTDVTSDLMAKWLDKIITVEPGAGSALALAGYRGVGKSHFLATLGAITANPELRSRIGDSHVTASAQRLMRRHYPVAYVRRGICPTLLEELKNALAVVLEVEPSSLSDSVPDLLKTVADMAGQVPFILMIDTAFERDSRVTRDDGAFLGEVAGIAKNLNIFIGVALDDDIAGADGINSAIAGEFVIDYLDQEHLYKIVDTHVFPKNTQMQPLLHEIYNYFREVLPSFRWSEQRFSGLYPLHPVIFETAPFVRLYVHEFALLSFASEAGTRILGRPANSLIALDEVFDNVEPSLRKINDLKEAFAAFDKLNDEVVGQIPVLQRLQAKLILKALLLLSLDGEGTTAAEIAAAMLIFDEDNPETAEKGVQELIDTFANASPGEIDRHVVKGREDRFGFKIRSKESLNAALGEAIKDVPTDIVPKTLRRLFRERFPDCTFSDENDTERTDWMDCQINWRGGLRRGRISWNFGSDNISPSESDLIDWELGIYNEKTDFDTTASEDIPRVAWQPDPLRADEIDTILRHHVLTFDTDLREEFSEQIRAAVQAHTIAVDKIWNRSFLQEGKLRIEGFDYNFTEEARAASTLYEMFTMMLEPLFENRYPDHPYFAETLGMNEVSTLVTDLFSGARSKLAEVQHLAKTFARPLGLVTTRGDSYVPESEEALAVLPLAREVFKIVDRDGRKTVTLKSIYARLKEPPYGLVREAQHLLLTALVAQRQLEFVTSNGDRINRRSLDLEIIWDDIVGVAKPAGVVFPAEKLTRWAKTLTGIEVFKSIEDQDDREAIRIALGKWLTEWKAKEILERFNKLPDETLNTRIWRLASHARKTFGVVADSVAAGLENNMTLDEALHRVADAFSDSETEFHRRMRELVIMQNFIEAAPLRSQVDTYLSRCEITADTGIEDLREALNNAVRESYNRPGEAANAELEMIWTTFHERFSDHYAASHDAIMRSHALQEKFDRIMRGDDWWEFENLSRIGAFPRIYWNEVARIRRLLRQLDCRFNAREMLLTYPFCSCPFSLAKADEWEALPEMLSDAIRRGLGFYREQIGKMKGEIIPLLTKFAGRTKEKELSSAADAFVKILKNGKEIATFSNTQLAILQQIFSELTPQERPASQNGEDSYEDQISPDEIRFETMPDEAVTMKA